MVGTPIKGFYGKTMPEVAPEYQGHPFTSLTELGTGETPFVLERPLGEMGPSVPYP